MLGVAAARILLASAEPKTVRARTRVDKEFIIMVRVLVMCVTLFLCGNAFYEK